MQQFPYGIAAFLYSLYKKTPNTGLFSFLKQSFTKSKLLGFKNFESLVLDAFLPKTEKPAVFLLTLYSEIINVMIQIDDKLISLDMFEKHFICDLPQCLGACCVEGESGAPLEDDETEILESILPVVKPLLSEKAIQEIEKKGAWEIDGDGDKVTPIINGRECVYTFFDEKGVCKCAIEQCYNEGKIDFRKPVSCHLYPIRITKYKEYEAINYHKWHICEAARLLGEKEQLPVFKFLKDAIVRKYGAEFYNEMEEAARLLEENPPYTK